MRHRSCDHSCLLIGEADVDAVYDGVQANFGYAGVSSASRTRAAGGLVILTMDAGGCHGARRRTPRGRGPQRPGAGPPQGCFPRLLTGAGLALARHKDVVPALRRMTPLPAGLILAPVVLPRGTPPQAAGRRQHAAT